MQVSYVWKDSRFLNGEWVNRAVTSYWVQASRKDLNHILSFAEANNSLLEDIEANTNSEDEPFYLLVAEDLSSIVNMPHYYPESGQWNGASPFEEVEPIVINDLNELKSLDV